MLPEYTQVDLDAAKRSAREHDARVRSETEGVMLIDFGALVDDMIRFMPEGIDGERREGYVEAVRDLFLNVGACTMEQSATDGSLARSSNAVSVPLTRVDRALARRAERDRCAPRGRSGA